MIYIFLQENKISILYKVVIYNMKNINLQFIDFISNINLTIK